MKALTLAAVVVCSGAAIAQQAQVYKPGSGVTSPEVVRDARPAYTAEAMRAKIQGEVEVEAVVQADGTLTGVRVLRSLDAGLDASAVDAMKASTFKPAMLGRRAVPYRITMRFTFTLRN